MPLSVLLLIVFYSYSVGFLLIFFQLRENRKIAELMTFKMLTLLNSVLLQLSTVQAFHMLEKTAPNIDPRFDGISDTEYRRILMDTFITEVKILAASSDSLTDPHLLDTVDYLLTTPVFEGLSVS
jgi:hypothetical protein